MHRSTAPEPIHSRRQFSGAVLVGIAMALVGGGFLMRALAADRAPTPPDLRRGGGWCLHSMTIMGVESLALRNPPVTIRFGRRSFSGLAPNNYSGRLRVRRGGRISLGLMDMTEMGSKPAVMKQETSFIGRLDKITTYAFDGEDLVLSDGTPENVLRFRAAVGAPVKPK
ncbi:MAG: META domain-containing protein [Verrucomicrobiales bacterium]